jgi:hypothetical protein
MTEPERPQEPVAPGQGDLTSGFQLDGVSLVGDPALGAQVTEGLTLLVDATGFVIVGPELGASRRVQWSAVASAVVGLVVAGTEGGIATPLDVTASGRTVRFMLPASRVSQAQVSLLERLLLEWKGAFGPQPGEDGPAPGTWPSPGPWSQGPVGPPPGAWPHPTPGPSWAGGQPPRFADLAMGTFESGWAVQTIDHLAEHSRRRRRRIVGMTLSMLLVLSGVGVWVGLAATEQSFNPSTLTTQPSPDQQLARDAMLNESDLPAGWLASPGDSNGTSAADRKAEQRIAKTFQTCMGVSADQATTVLGGQSKDQTAQAQSPVYVGPDAGATAGAATELQSSAAVVRTHADEKSDYAVYSNPRFPQCNAVAGAAEAQIGLNDSSGDNDQPGPAVGHAVPISPFHGEQLLEVESTFTLNAGGHPVVVQNYQVVVAGDRIEASLGAFAVGTGFPSGVLSGSVSTLEHRVASEGLGKGSA